MKYALNLDADGRVLSATYEQYANDAAVLVDNLPEGNLADYQYINGEFIYTPLPLPEAPAELPTLEDQVAELREALNLLLEGATE